MTVSLAEKLAVTIAADRAAATGKWSEHRDRIMDEIAALVYGIEIDDKTFRWELLRRLITKGNHR